MNREQMLQILETEFERNWFRFTNRMNYEIIDLVRNSFLIDEMLESLNSKEYNLNYTSSNRYQRYILVSLTRQFTMLLYVVSKEGNEVNRDSIFEAQKILKEKGSCPIMPCIKPKN